MTQEELEALKNANTHSTEFGAVTEILRWPSVVITYSVDGRPPVITGRKEELTVTTKEGELPEISGQTPLGEATLSSDTVGAMASWPPFEAELKGVLEGTWQAVQDQLAAQRAQGQSVPPPS